MNKLINKKSISSSISLSVLSITIFLISAYIFSINIANAQTTTKKTLKDFGLSEESVKWLSQKEIDEILSSKTPAESKIEIEKARLEWEKLSTSTREKTPPPFPLVPSTGSSGKTLELENIVNCFDYYKFGSVQVNLHTASTNVITGTKMQFTGNITNNNDYPVVGGSHYIKIMKIRAGGNDANGPAVVDQFIVKDNISIPAHKSVPVSFEWFIPLYSEEGDYMIANYFITDNKFNLLGLSFTDDVTGNTFDFHVDGIKNTVAFEKSFVTINKAPYFFAAFPPRIDNKNSANIVANIMNTTNQDQKVNVVWKLYKWDSINPDNFIREIKKSYSIKAKSITPVDMLIADKEFPVYYLVAELTYKDTKSILNIRYVRDGVDKVRLNFPSITAFPIEKGKTSTMFSCLHNSGTSQSIPDNKLIMKIYEGPIADNTMKTPLVEYTYEGPVTGEMMAVKKDFVSKKNLDKFSLYTELWSGGKIVDQSTIYYDCNSIDPNLCNKKSNNVLVTTIAIIALILIALAFGIHRKRTVLATYILAMIISSAFLFSPTITEAKSFVWTQQYTDSLYYYWNNAGNAFEGRWSGWESALGPRTVNIKYNVDIKNSGTNESINDGASLPVGTNLLLTFKPHKYADISWVGTGYSADSPYGQWRVDTEPPTRPDGINYGGLPSFYSSFSYSLGPDNNSVWCPNTDTANTLPIAELRALYERTYVNLVGVGNTSFFLDTLMLRNRADIASFVNNVDKFVYDLLPGPDGAVYIPLVVSPPTKTVTNTNGMTCGSLTGNETNGYSMQCTITTAGPLNPTFNFASTFGKYYYRYFMFAQTGADYNQTWGCHGNNAPLHTDKSSGTVATINVPIQTISYNFNATAIEPLNQPPSAPIITGPNHPLPSTGTTETSYTFNFISTDPNGDQVAYMIDWDNDGDVEYYTGFVDSGVEQNAIKGWIDEGEHTFRVKAYDIYIASSPWTSHTITLSLAPPEPINLSCSSLGVTPPTIVRYDADVESAVLHWTSTNAIDCTVTENPGGRTWSGISGSETLKPPVGTYTYSMVCTNASATPNSCTLGAMNSVQLTVNTPSAGSLPLWLNDVEGKTSVKVRPGQEFGLNWDTGDISGFVSNSCRGTVYDAGDVPIDITGWTKDSSNNTVILPNDKSTIAMPLTVANKGEYTFEIGCKKLVGETEINVPGNNTVEVQVVQPTINER